MPNAVSRARTNHIQGFLFALGAAALRSTSFVTGKYGLQGFNAQTFSLIWVVAAFVFCLAAVLLAGDWPSVVAPRQARSKILLMGICTGVGMILAWAALDQLDPSFASFLGRFLPALTILLGVVVLRERLSRGDLLPAVIMLAGGGLSALGRWHIVGSGLVLMLLANVALATQGLVAKSQVADVSPNVLALYRTGIAMVVVAVWAVISGGVHVHAEARHWLATILGAFLSPCAGYLLLFRSYRHWDLSRASIVQTVQPLFVLPLAYFALGKLPARRELLGGCVILVGAFLWALGRSRERARGRAVLESQPGTDRPSNALGWATVSQRPASPSLAARLRSMRRHER